MPKLLRTCKREATLSARCIQFFEESDFLVWLFRVRASTVKWCDKLYSTGDPFLFLNLQFSKCFTATFSSSITITSFLNTPWNVRSYFFFTFCLRERPFYEKRQKMFSLLTVGQFSLYSSTLNENKTGRIFFNESFLQIFITRGNVQHLFNTLHS